MFGFTNILFSPLRATDNTAAASRTLELAERAGASLTMLGVVETPSALQRLIHSSGYEQQVIEHARQAIQAQLTHLRPGPSHPVPTDEKILVGDPSTTIVAEVIESGHDLLVVTTDDDRHDKATIRRLLRSCPCPVWVIRPSPSVPVRVMAAVNPDPDEVGLNRRVMELAAAMADLLQGDLHVIHAWDFYGEATLRSSAFIHTTDAEVDDLVAREQTACRDALDELIVTEGPPATDWAVHLVKGPPATTIVSAVSDEKVTLLVMGTIARTGVPGIIMGNTAERVLDDVTCSVLAVKPPGFVSGAEIS